MNDRRRATIYDLSQETGFSSSTVAAVLNGTWKKRRISEGTAEIVQNLARQRNYMPNIQAQGLRRADARLVGLIIPNHDSRFFASIAQHFEIIVRHEGKCPIVVSANRNPETEKATVRTVISHGIDALLVCGAADPDGIDAICSEVGLRHVNIDLPGTKASSVISDNLYGGAILTNAILAEAGSRAVTADDVHFFGGQDDVATKDRIRGFSTAVSQIFGAPTPNAIHLTGYDPISAQRAFEGFYRMNGRVPARIFINGPSTYEGFLHFAAAHPDVDVSELRIGCYDYDPFISFSIYKTWMIKQKTKVMITKAFELLDDECLNPRIVKIKPELVPPHSPLYFHKA